MAAAPPSLPPLRRFVTPLSEETRDEIAARARVAPDELERWNPHIFESRRPPGLITASDILFIEPPQP